MDKAFADLLKVDVGLRDHQWEQHFFASFVHQPLRLLHASPQPGPDGFSYLVTESTDGEGEPAQRVVEWLAERGIGLVVNPHKTYPDYVFTYGMLWNYRERGEFLSEVAAPLATPRLELKVGQQVWLAEPSNSYLPTDVRALIKQFLFDQGVLNPKIVLMSTDQKNYDLVFSIESLGAPKTAEHIGIGEALSWFLPAHYSVALLSEKNISGFIPL